MYMKNYIFRIALAAVTVLSCLLTAGCHDDEVSGTQAYLDSGTQYLSVTKRGVTWSGEAVRIDLHSNTYWTASLAEADREWLALDRMGGDGDAVIELTVAENEGDKRTAAIEFRALHGLSCTVTVSQSGAGDSYYYYRDDFGTGASMVDAAEYGFEPQGIGVFRGGYSASGVAVDSGSSSEGYEGASGGNNLYLHDAGAFVSYGAFNTHKDTDFVLSFASMCEHETFDRGNLRFYISCTGRADSWAEIEYERSAAPEWTYTRVPFVIKEGVSQLYVKAESASGGCRIDDLSIDEGDESGENIVFPEDIVNWVERIIFFDNFEWMTSDKGNSMLPGNDGDRMDNQYKEDMHGWTVDPVFVYVRPGFPKLGKTTTGGGLVTPRLSAIGEEKMDITVEFDAAHMSSDFDALQIAVRNGGLIASTQEAQTVINIASSNQWAHFSVDIVNATKDTQIQFRSGVPDATQAAQSRSNRFFLDNVKIYYKERIQGAGTIATDVESVAIPADGTAQKIVVESTLPWSAKADDDWVVCSPASGDAGTTEVFVTGATTTGAERSSSVLFSSGEKVTARVAVVQLPSQLSAPVPVCTTSEPSYVIFEWPRAEHAFAGQSYAYELYEGSTDGAPVMTMDKQAFTKSQFDTRVAFPNLKPATKYFMRVKALSTDTAYCLDSDFSAFAEGSTAAPTQPDPDALLEQHFDDLRWGSDYMRGAYGFRPKADADEKAATTFDVPLTRIAEPQTSISDYMSFTPEVKAAAGLTGWEGAYVYGHLGATKVGGWKKTGWLKTPALSKISGVQDIALTFKICAYIDYGDGKASDSKTMTLTVEGAGTPEKTEFAMENFAWTSHTVIIRGATADTRIKFNTATDVDGRRFLIDDIVVKSEGEVLPSLTTPAPTLAYAEPHVLAFEWPRIADELASQKYTCVLRKERPNGAVVHSFDTNFSDTKYATRVAYGNLDPSTKYYFSVRALSSDAAVVTDSGFSASVEAVTSAARVPDPAAILEQHFDRSGWGGDYMRNAYGFRPATDAVEKGATSFDVELSRSSNPAGSTSDYMAFTSAFRELCGLDGWSGQRCYGFIGCMKLGTASAAGYIQTPELAKIEGTKDVVLTFKSCAWCDYGKTAGDAGTMIIEVTGGGTADRTELTHGTFGWTEQRVTISGATSTTRIKFTQSVAAKGRLFLDDIVIVGK